MERLVNQLILMIANLGGGEHIMKDIIQKVNDAKYNEKTWTPEEVSNVLKYVSWYNEYFGRADALARIDSMVQKYQIGEREITFVKKPKQAQQTRWEYAPEECWPTEYNS